LLPRDLYEIVHVVGIALVMVAFGGIALHAAEGGTRRGPRAHHTLLDIYDSGLFLILLNNFNMLTQIKAASGGIAGFPGWLWAKLAVWTVLGAIMMLPYRKPGSPVPVLVATPLLAGLATYFALYKPF